MAKIHYKALTEGGSILSGTLEAHSEAAAIQQLRARGHYPIWAGEISAGRWRSWLTLDWGERRLSSNRELAMAANELSMLLQAGLPLDRALAILVELGETASLRSPLQRVLTKVRDGAVLSDSLGEDPIFPKLMVSILHAGERSGDLEGALRRLGDYLSKAQAVRDAVISALIYPSVLLATACLSIAVILGYVLPAFEPLFRSAGKSLPLATRLLMIFGEVLGTWWWAIVLIFLGSLAALKRGLGRPDFRLKWDAAILRLPVLGPLLAKIEMEKFSRTLGLLLVGGMPLPAAMAITRDTLGNAVIADAVGAAAASLREGEGVAERLARSRFFPPIALDFMRVGEETGRLDEMLLRQADIFERAIKHSIERLLTLLVPTLTVTLGIIVAAIIASMLMAIVGINDLAVR